MMPQLGAAKALRAAGDPRTGNLFSAIVRQFSNRKQLRFQHSRCKRTGDCETSYLEEIIKFVEMHGLRATG